MRGMWDASLQVDNQVQLWLRLAGFLRGSSWRHKPYCKLSSALLLILVSFSFVDLEKCTINMFINDVSPAVSPTRMEGGLKSLVQLVVVISAMYSKAKASRLPRMNDIASIAFPSHLFLPIRILRSDIFPRVFDTTVCV